MKSLLILFLVTLSTINAQSIKVYGIVKDASTGENLPFASVSLENGSKGATTDMDGKYTLQLIPGTYHIMASYVGYKTEIVPIELNKNDLEVNFNLTATGILLQEVSVYASADKEESVSSISLKSKEMVEISSVMPDVFRSIQSLPGIAANNEFSGKFNVRGGNFDENLVLVNGAQVYEPFHVKEADNASFGIFNVDLMKKVNLITGGFSAQYGDRLSSVLNIEYREGNNNRFTGSTSLSLTNLDAVFEGPLGSKVNYIIGLRKSYLEYALLLLDIKENVRPSFYDVQGVVTYNLSEINKLQFKFIHAGDNFVLDPTTDTYSSSYNATFINRPSVINQSEIEIEKEHGEYYSNLFDVRHSLIISGNAFLNTSVSYYYQVDRENYYYTSDFNFKAVNNRSYFYKSFYTEINNKDLGIKTLEAKTSLDTRLNPFYDIKAGFSYLKIKYEENSINNAWRQITQNIDVYPDTLRPIIIDNDDRQKIDASSYKLYGYLENILQLSNNLILNAGARLDYFDFNHDLTFSPRLSVSYKFDAGTNIRAAWGYYYQSPIYRQLAYSTPSDTNTQSQKAEHYILSAERSFIIDQASQNSFTLKTEVYYKKYSDLISSERTMDGNLTYSRRNDSKGYAAGFDIYASLKFDNYFGWISYGLLFSKEELLTDNSDEFPRYTDQRHTLSLVNDLDLGKQWNLNLRFTFGSGFAYTPFTSVFNADSNRYYWIEGEKNSAHLPSYKRADIRISKSFLLFDFQATAFLDVSNLFNFKNIYAYRFRFDDQGNPVKREIELWPVIPTLGLTVNF